jgi:predicted transcriptional regulator
MHPNNDEGERWIMVDDNSVARVDPHLVAEIVRSYVAKNRIAVDQIGGLIATVRQTLSGLAENNTAPTSSPEKLTPAVPIRRSVQPDHVVCLECGLRALTLRRHLRVAHGLEPAAYRVRWKLATDHALTAPAYSERRSTMAKQLGLGQKRAEAETRPGRAAAGGGRRLHNRPRRACVVAAGS